MKTHTPSFYYFLLLFSQVLLCFSSCGPDQRTTVQEYAKDSIKKNAVFFFPESNPVTVGCYYYPEQWPVSEWDNDLKRMAALGFEFTHYGEFAWSLMEPEEGKFDFSWLDKAIEIAGKYKLKVILCTPSPTPPAWLVHKHPEVLMQNEEGRVMQHGSRQQGSWSSKIYQEYCVKIVTELAKRYKNNPSVFGWQLDNEPSHYNAVYDYNEASQEGFRTWLEKKYVHIDSLNNRWGNNFWSQRYNNFKQIRIPNQKELVQQPNPHGLLDFQEFTNEQRGIFLRLQANTLRNYISDKQFITTNYMMQLPHIDPWVNKTDMDFASYTYYPVNSYSETENDALGFRLGAGRDLSLAHDFFQSVNGQTGIMELQPGQVNWGRYNAQPYPGAVRMWIWHTFAIGSKFICTYRYRQPLYGNEQYHQGIIQTDGESLSRGGKEYVQAIKELNEIKKVYRIDKVEKSKIGIWWDQRSMLDMYNFPHNQNWNPVTNFYRYYEIIKSFALPVEFLTNASNIDPQRYSVILIPAVQLVDDALVSKWEKYVEAGGTLIITARTGQKNRDGHWWKTEMQKKIQKLTNVSILYYDHLPPSKIARVTKGSKTYSWNSWGEIINLTKDSNQTKVLAVYSDQFYEGKAAAISGTVGKGKVVYIGVTTNDGAMEKEILKETFEENELPLVELPKNIFIEKRGNLRIAVNYSSYPFELTISKQQEILLGERSLKPGGVTVWKE
jgi:beta-galactosidase